MAYYVSRRGTGLGAVPLSRMAAGLGAGLDPPSEECPQPVHTDERDALRAEIKPWTSPWQVPHFAEGRPVLAAIYKDITGRLSGLEQRPKLLRCSKEARDRAHNWIGQLRELCQRVKSDGAHCSGYTRIPQAFSFTVYRGPTYQVPADQTPAAAAPVQSSAPPGSVVVNGQVYSSSAAAIAATAPPSSPIVETAGGGGGTWQPPAAYAPGPGDGFMAGELVPGVPNMYLVYGAGALLAWRMLKGK